MKRFLAMLLTLVIMAGVVPTMPGGLTAEAAEAPADYYGARLEDPAAIAFYQALEAMDFRSGNNLPVTDPSVIELAESYAGGSDAMIRSFGAAVDSFRYDHTEFFYVDWDMLSVNVGRKSGQYVVNIGAGRTDSYLRNKDADIAGQITAYDTALESMVASIRSDAGSDASVKELAKTANDAVCNAVTYDFCDDEDGSATEESKYIRTAYGALVNGRAVCEGYSRLYKAVLNELGVKCELVSGYFLDGESFEPHMWNYVQDEEGRWYAVDVTMNDGHRLQAGGTETEFEKYFWQTEELFSIDHIEDGKVSSVEYVMPYPELYRFWKSPTESGRFACGIKAYEGEPAFSFSFDGKSADELLENGLYMALRFATTNTGTLTWTPWQSVQEYNRLIPEIAPSVGHETYFRGRNIAMPVLEVGVFDIAEDVDHKVGDTVVSHSYSEDAVTTHLIETVGVENPSHDPEYIAPAYVKRTEPEELFQRRQNITETQHVVLEYDMPLRETGDGFELTWDVSSYNNRDLSLEAVQKNARLENVQFDGDRTISFDFTPSRAYNHNMIFYNFTIHNMVNVLPDDSDGVALRDFSIMYEYKDSIACCKIYNDGRLYVNSYAQPSIAMNGDLSMTGWTYDDDGVTRKVSESQRSQMALVVTRPNNSEELVDKAAEHVTGGEEAIARSTTYEIDLNICGKILKIPNGSYMKLNLGIPDEFADLVGKEDITFKLYHFKRIDGTDELDYNNPELIDCVLTPYGLIATVSSFSPYVLVALDNSKLPAEDQDTSKGIALMCNGHGGKVESSIPAAGVLEKGGAVTYTLTPDEGYEVEYVRLNGKSVTVSGNTVTLGYDELDSNSTLEVGFVAASVKEAERNNGIDNVTHGTACTVTFHSNGGSDVDPVYVESGTAVEQPEDPTRAGYQFAGWYTDHLLIHPYDFSIPVASSIALYAKWEPKKRPGAGLDPTDESSVTPLLKSDNLSPYLFGKKDGLIHPNDLLTRAEAAAILYRLLEDDAQTAASGKDVPFTDTPKGAWYYDSAAALYALDIIHGRSEKTFAPDFTITRAEFVQMCAALIQELPEDATPVSFTDLDGHWAKASVEKASALGWVSGVGGGRFMPDENITRAEAVAITNRMLGRSVHSVEELGASMKTWADNMNTKVWYYLDVQAASNDCGKKSA